MTEQTSPPDRDRYGYIRHIAQDVQQLKVRFDDLTLRMALVEQSDRKFDEKVDQVKKDVLEKLAELAKAFTEDRTERKEERKWLFRTIAGAVVLAIVGFILSGGLQMIGKNLGG